MAPRKKQSGKLGNRPKSLLFYKMVSFCRSFVWPHAFFWAPWGPGPHGVAGLRLSTGCPAISLHQHPTPPHSTTKKKDGVLTRQEWADKWCTTFWDPVWPNLVMGNSRIFYLHDFLHFWKVTSSSSTFKMFPDTSKFISDPPKARGSRSGGLRRKRILENQTVFVVTYENFCFSICCDNGYLDVVFVMVLCCCCCCCWILLFLNKNYCWCPCFAPIASC